MVMLALKRLPSRISLFQVGKFVFACVKNGGGVTAEK